MSFDSFLHLDKNHLQQNHFPILVGHSHLPDSTRRRMDVQARAQSPGPEWDVVGTSKIGPDPYPEWDVVVTSKRGRGRPSVIVVF